MLGPDEGPPEALVDDIALALLAGGATNDAIVNAQRNVFGLMPHPEHAVDPDVGTTGGQPLFASLLTQALARV